MSRALTPIQGQQAQEDCDTTAHQVESQGSISNSERGPAKSEVTAQFVPSSLVFMNLPHLLLQIKGLVHVQGLCRGEGCVGSEYNSP